VSALAACDGFAVDGPDGRIGVVEEVWLGPGQGVRALAVRTFDGRHGLVPVESVAAVDRHYEVVFIRPASRLLELKPPRVSRDQLPAISAMWETTGTELSLAPVRDLRIGSSDRAGDSARERRAARPAEKPIWVTFLTLVFWLSVIIATVITVDFVVAKIVTGQAV
jgi:hypothetical protein